MKELITDELLAALEQKKLELKKKEQEAYAVMSKVTSKRLKSKTFDPALSREVRDTRYAHDIASSKLLDITNTIRTLTNLKNEETIADTPATAPSDSGM